MERIRFHVACNEKIDILYDPTTYDIYKINMDPTLFQRYELLSEDDPEIAKPHWCKVEEFIREYFYNTKERNLTEEFTSKNISDLVINISQACNLCCSYCYAKDLNNAHAVMNKDTAKRVLKAFFPLSGHGLNSIKFLGGEPTINFKVIEYLVNRTKSLSKEQSFKPPKFVIVTNGTISLTDSQIEFMKDNNFYVIVSLDGPKVIHDTLRPFHNGSGSFEKVIATVSKLLECGVEVGIESTFTAKHVEMQITPMQLVKFFESLDVHQFKINPVAGTWHGVEIVPYIDKIIDQFREVVRYCIYSLTTKSPSLLLNSKFVLLSLAKLERKAYICDAGRNFLSVNYDGSVFACYLLESPETYMGNVFDENWPSEKFMQVTEKFWKMSKDNNPICRKCWANEICSACYGPSFLLSQRLEKPPEWFCKFSKAQIEETLICIAEIRQSSDKWRALIEGLKSVLSGAS